MTCGDEGRASREVLAADFTDDTEARRDYRSACVKSFVTVIGLGVFLATVSLGLAAEKPPMSYVPLRVANGCFVETVAMLDEWQGKMGGEAWAKMLRWGAKEEEEVVAGHAVAVVEMRGKLWCWDVNFGWAALPMDAAQRENAETVVVPVVARYAKVKAQYPSYFADFPQAAGAAPKLTDPASGAEGNAALRDVLAVAERLAHRRPVTVVTFSYGPEGSPRASAAAVFVFGGRYCVYVPEIGTVPTRARGGVENLRMIQTILRRMCPGTGVVTKR